MEHKGVIAPWNADADSFPDIQASADSDQVIADLSKRLSSLFTPVPNIPRVRQIAHLAAGHSEATGPANFPSSTSQYCLSATGEYANQSLPEWSLAREEVAMPQYSNNMPITGSSSSLLNEYNINNGAFITVPPKQSITQEEYLHRDRLMYMNIQRPDINWGPPPQRAASQGITVPVCKHDILESLARIGNLRIYRYDLSPARDGVVKCTIHMDVPQQNPNNSTVVRPFFGPPAANQEDAIEGACLVALKRLTRDDDFAIDDINTHKAREQHRQLTKARCWIECKIPQMKEMQEHLISMKNAEEYYVAREAQLIGMSNSLKNMCKEFQDTLPVRALEPDVVTQGGNHTVYIGPETPTTVNERLAFKIHSILNAYGV